ncbi:hypothetical protein [Thiomicrorhabdus sp. Kp2]|uniref:hypothetical protein n=1 Tax=Thiomicrorhabdus sp. Kp2 TaxID=1123518 RepID=UPI0004030E89|nr:hypothetical protein [Thiomicrorhabdus sp. Kp2]
MSKIQFSNNLFSQIGGSNWVTRPGYFDIETKPLNNGETLGNNQNEPFLDSIDNQVDLLEEKNLLVEEPLFQSKVQAQTVTSVVVLGAGLESVWQNDESLAWQLWQNIMKAFDWDETQVVFFDTELLVTEDAVFSTMEEVIDLGVEWVLTMDEEHEISEQLSEGVQVVSVPEFELMLSDPYAKQSFYHSVVSLNRCI